MNVALLTGRKGSSMKDKNIRMLLGVPLAAYPCKAAIDSNIFDRMFCSSDSDELNSIAEGFNFKKIIRPKKLASDTAKHVDVIEHAIIEIEADIGKIDTLTIMMANCPTITKENLSKSYEILKKNKNLNSIVPVIKNQDQHPFRARKVNSEGLLENYFEFENTISSNRQELPNNYFLTHSFWMINLINNKLPFSTKSTPWDFLGDNCAPFEVCNSIDVHEETDLIRCEEWLKNN